MHLGLFGFFVVGGGGYRAIATNRPMLFGFFHLECLPLDNKSAFIFPLVPSLSRFLCHSNTKTKGIGGYESTADTVFQFGVFRFGRLTRHKYGMSPH